MNQYDENCKGIINAFIDPDSIELDDVYSFEMGDGLGLYPNTHVCTIKLKCGFQITFTGESARRIADRAWSRADREKRKNEAIRK